jgi:hypothetical protein
MSYNIKVISFLLIVFCLIVQVLCISQKTEQQAVNLTEILMKKDSSENLINWTHKFHESPIGTVTSSVVSGFSGYLSTDFGKIHAVCGVILTGVIHVLCA